MKSRLVFVLIAGTLALGIGASSAVFSVIHAVLLKPLAAPEPDRLVMVWMQNQSLGYEEFFASLSDLRDIRDGVNSLQAVAPHGFGSVNLTSIRPAEALNCAWVEPGIPRLLGAKTAAGRLFVDSDGQPDRDHVAILSYRLWQRRFGGDMELIGKPLTLNREVYTVVGVAAPDFDGPIRFDIGGAIGIQEIDLWVPLSWQRTQIGGEDLTARHNRVFQCLARLRPGVSPERASAELSALGSRLAQQYPDTNRGWSITLQPLREQMVRGSRTALWLLMLAVVALLSIACTNISSLLLARGIARERELAIRAALGAVPARIIGLLLSESALYALGGGAAGLLIAYVGTTILPDLFLAPIPRLRTARLDGAVVLFAVGASLASVLLFGLVPALQVCRPDLAGLTHANRRIVWMSKQSLFGLLITLELVLATALLIAASLFLVRFVRLAETNPGFQAGRVSSSPYYLPTFAYPNAEQQARFVRKVLSTITMVPGIEAAGAIDFLPFSGDEFRTSFTVEGQAKGSSNERREANYRRVSPEYFKTLGIPLRRGRTFTERDDPKGKPVILINETMARQFFSGGDPIGRRVNTAPSDTSPAWREIVGVVGDVKYMKLDETPFPNIYAPMSQEPGIIFSIVVRSPLSPLEIKAAFQKATQSVDPDQPAGEVTGMEQLLRGSAANDRLYATLAAIFAAGAVLLSLMGVAGVTWFGASQRTFEIAVRIAVGASPRAVLRLLLVGAMWRASAGIAIGVALSAAVDRLLTKLVVQSNVPEAAAISVFAALVLGLACSGAAYLAARHAMRIQPSIVLRSQ